LRRANQSLEPTSVNRRGPAPRWRSFLLEIRTGKGNDMDHQYTQKKIQQQRDDLTGEHVVGNAGQIVLACLFAATWIADTFFWVYPSFPTDVMPEMTAFFR